MQIVPSSTITLYKDVDIGPGIMPCWSSAANRTSYFNSKKLKRGNVDISTCTCTVVKQKIGTLRLEISPITNSIGSNPTGAEVAKCNMLSFINPSFDNKEIYCRIVDYNYVNNECVEIIYIIDYFITWCFDVTYLDMYIERQHLSKADWTKAEANPYDPDILEFRTPEDLPISKELEKPCYNILNWTYDSNPPTDGYNVTGFDGRKLLHTRGKNATSRHEEDQMDNNLCGTMDYWCVLLYLTPINWNEIGEEARDTWNDLIDGLNVWYWSKATHYDTDLPTDVADLNDLWTGLTPASDIFCFKPVANDYTNIYKKFFNVINFLTGLGLDGQINAMYLVPAQIVDAATIDFTNVSVFNDYYNALASQDVVREKTSEAHDLQHAVTNKKLLNFPYSYLRVACEDGTKEFKYENFKAVQDGGNDCSFKLIATLVGVPRLLLVPFKYGKNVTDKAPAGDGDNPDVLADITLANYSLEDAIVIATFPQIEYSTDGYLTFLAGEYSAIRANMTTDTELEQRLQQERIADSSVYTAGGMLASLASLNPGTIGGSLMSGTATLQENQRQLRSLENTYARQREAESYFNSPENFSKIAAGENKFDRFDNTRPAHANNIFHAGASMPTLNMIKGMGGFDFTSIHVQLREDVLDMYDNFFNLFGYNTGGKCAMPYVINFINGVSDTAANAGKLPHWATVNNQAVTYLKTYNAKVEYAMQPVAEAITAMLNSGVRFLNCNPS